MSSSLLNKSNKPEINLLEDFYRKIVQTNDFNYFEKLSIEWITHKLESNYKNPKEILEVMQNHKEYKFWFTSLTGFFYQCGIGCVTDRKKAMELYLLAINNESDESFIDLERNNNKNIFNTLRNKNIIIGKYLLSLFYYRNIILDIEGFN